MTSPIDLPQMPELPAPVTPERLADVLAELKYPMTRNEQGALVGRTTAATVEVSFPDERNQVLLFRGTRIGTLPSDRIADVELFANNWHRERLWPTVVVLDGPEGVVVQAHVGVDVVQGLTETQLRENARIGVGTLHQVMTALAEQLDDAREPGLGEGPGPQTGPVDG